MNRQELETALGLVLEHPDLGGAARASLEALKTAQSVSISHDPTKLIDRERLIETYRYRQRLLDQNGAEIVGLAGTLSLLTRLDCKGVDVIVAQLHPGHLTLFADPSGAIVGVLDLSWVRRDDEEPT